MSKRRAPSPEPVRPDPAPPAVTGARAAVERQLAALEDLTTVGLGIAQALGRRVAATDEDGATVEASVLGEVSLAYTRVSRAVRMSVLLQSRLSQELQGPRPAADLNAWERKRRVVRIVGRVIAADRDGDDDGDEDRLVREVRERVELDDLYGDVMTLPTSEIVARICKDLGLSPDWPRIAGEAWAEEEIQSGWAGSPLAALAPEATQGRSGGVHRDGVILFRPPP